MDNLYCVGIGASAGGLEAIEKFFQNMPEDTGMTFVVVQHLSPDYKSLMSELLSRHTKMPIHRVKDGMSVHPDNIYLIPPKKNMTIFGGRLYLTDHDHSMGLNLPIDIFFRSLAQDFGKNSIGIVLSGTGSDGALGIKAIKESGGTVFVQDDKSAKFDGMPRSSIATGMVDYVLSPVEMPDKLISYIKHPFITKTKETKDDIEGDSVLLKILKMIRDETGVDFTYYKPNTILRRLEKRLGINQIEDYEQYLDFMKHAPKEVNILYKDLLIGVTQFFRDSDAFDIIEEVLLPGILKNKNRDDAIRVWSVGCSTGEEAYSIAMLISEYIEKNDEDFDIKIFATDIDRQHIEIAGLGNYPESIVTDVSPERLEKFFEKNNGGYHVNEKLRKKVIFAQHNIIKDPPFSKIDFIICRNMLIYLNPEMQRKIISMFYYSLIPGGGLFLGSSETLGEMSEGFDVISNKWKIYKQKSGFRPTVLNNFLMPNVSRSVPSGRHTDYQREYSNHDKPINDSLMHDVLDKIMPASVIVDSNFQILHIFGDVNEFVKIPPGKVKFDLISMVRKDISVVLNSILYKVINENKEVEFRKIQSKETDKPVNITAKPVKDRINNKKYILIFFEYSDDIKKKGENVETFDLNSQLSEQYLELEKELQFTKENLQATIEELETSNEELQSTNEELIASNEELQSTNEELQSVNEELYTVNSEYQKKIEELTQLNNDMNNLLKNTSVGILYLDKELRIRKYTNMVTRVINILDMDINRPIRHISLNVKYNSFISDIEHVRDTLEIKELELLDKEGNWNLIRIQPYRTEHNAVDGIAITITDISKLKSSEFEARSVSEQLRLALSIGNLAWWDWDFKSGKVKFSDEKALMLGYEPDELKNNDVYDWTKMIHPDDYDTAMAAMKSHIEGERPDYEVEYRIRTKKGKWKWFYDKGGALNRDEKGLPLRLAGIVSDVTGLKEKDYRHKHLFDSIKQGVVYQDAEGIIFAANNSAQRIMGISLEQMCGRQSIDPRWKSVHENGSEFPGAQHPAMIALKTGKPVTDVIMGIFNPEHDGYRWISVSSYPQLEPDEKKPYLVFSIFEDITENREKALELKKQNELFYNVLDNSPLGKLLTDKDGNITYANRAAMDIFELPKTKFLERKYNASQWNIKDAEGKEIPDKYLPFKLVTGQMIQIKNYVLQVNTGSNDSKLIEIHGSPILDSENEANGAVFSIKEIDKDELPAKKSWQDYK
jgi:two-component system CheB/CheR fusion protein